jgi:hypothetical protein
MTLCRVSSESRNKMTVVAVATLVILNVLVYYPVLFQGFVQYDDHMWVDAVRPPGWNSINLMLERDTSRWGKLGYFAPVTALSFMADLVAAGWIGHEMTILKASNLIWHVLNSLLVLWLLRLLGFDLWVAFTAAAIFSLHPLQVSTVAWLTERKNLVMGFFFLSALILHLYWRRADKPYLYGAVLVSYALAILAKPAAVVLGPCIVMTDWFLIDKRLTARSIVSVTPLVLLGLLWTVVAIWTEGKVSHPLPLMDRILLAPYSMAFLMWKFLVPIDLSLLYPRVEVDASSLIWWMPAVMLVASGVLMLVVHRIRPMWVALWCLGFYGANFAPSSGIVPFGGMKELWVANHYQYLSIIGLSLLVCAAVAWVARKFEQPASFSIKALVTSAAIIGLGVLSSGQLKAWKNAESLWQSVLRVNPTSLTANQNLGDYFDEQGRFREAALCYRRALQSRPEQHKVWYNLGLVTMKLGQLQDAAEYLHQALLIRPDFGKPHLDLAKIYFAQGWYDKALEHCRKAKSLGADCRPDQLRQAIEERLRKGKE